MFLDKIIISKRDEVSRLRKHGIRKPESSVDAPRGFKRALTMGNGIAIIAEAKKASPSKGLICSDFDVTAIAVSYERGGARAMSVLTDEFFFQGRLEYILRVRERVGLPILRKDFIIDEIQIQEAHAYGADAVLLIAAILSLEQIEDYQAMAAEMGMDVLVEIHDEEELLKTLRAGSPLIGINNRNLKDFTVNLDTTYRLKREIPLHIPVVSESGIRDRMDIEGLENAGVCAALIGESLMRAPDRAVALRRLLGISSDD